MEFWLIALAVGWIPNAAACRWLAGLKGHDVSQWTVAGLAFGPIALVAIGLAPRGFGEPFQACIECSEPIYLSATKCPHCQTDFIAEAQTGSEPAT